MNILQLEQICDSHAVFPQKFSSAQRADLSQSQAAGTFGTAFPYDIPGRNQRSTGGDDIVHEKDPVIRPEGSFLRLKRAFRVFGFVGVCNHASGELPLLAQGNKRDPEHAGQHRAEDEAPRFHSRHLGDGDPRILQMEAVVHLVAGGFHGIAVAEDAPDILEEDAGDGEILKILNGFEQPVGWFVFLKCAPAKLKPKEVVYT